MVDRIPSQTFTAWGLRTLGELAALPAADLVSRLGRPALVWQAIARGEDVRPLVPTLPEERFESSLELEWPIEGLEPLSFVLTRLLEPLSMRLERRDRGAAVLHVLLSLVTRRQETGPGLERGSEREVYMRRLELPSPMHDVRALRTLAMLDLESHPPPAAIDRVTVVIDPTPGRVLQHTLYARPHPTPDELSTLLARLGALMGQDRIGAATTVDTYRPGAFAMTRFKTEHKSACGLSKRERASGVSPSLPGALRRCRQPVPARVAVVEGRPVRVTTDRQGFVGGAVTACAGPWRSSGEWWELGHWGPRGGALGEKRAVGSARGPSERERASEASGGGAPRAVSKIPHAWSQVGRGPHAWSKDEWDVALNDGAVYRIFHDRQTDGWFIDAIVD
jgi:protein ImuB